MYAQNSHCAGDTPANVIVQSIQECRVHGATLITDLTIPGFSGISLLHLYITEL